jgi:hypothetical protein
MSPVALFDMGIVVLAVRLGTGEEHWYGAHLKVSHQIVIQKLSAIV